MKHFNEEDCVDYARGVAPPELTVALQRHLDSGCQKCLKSLVMWQTILEIAREEAGASPPKGAVWAAEAYYGMYRPWESKSRRPTLAELVFDSFRQPIPAGARSSVSFGRQLLYKSEELDVDIHMRFQEDSSRILLAGQILNARKPTANMKDISVTAIDKSRALAQTITNASGEFELEFDVKNVVLKIDTKKPRAIFMFLENPQSQKNQPRTTKGNR
jgi:hypothetical protein